jgi:hypothetical protein
MHSTPSIWSESFVCPVFKADDPNNPVNYWGIAINNSISKLFNKQGIFVLSNVTESVFSSKSLGKSFMKNLNRLGLKNYKYLGITMENSGNFTEARKQLFQTAIKGSFKLCRYEICYPTY